MWISWSASVEFKCVSVIPRMSKRHMFCISLSSSILLRKLQIFRWPTRMSFGAALSTFAILYKSSAFVAKSAVKFRLSPHGCRQAARKTIRLRYDWMVIRSICRCLKSQLIVHDASSSRFGRLLLWSCVALVWHHRIWCDMFNHTNYRWRYDGFEQLS